ncbi:unnamed protein product [Rhizopus stolonifer]
MLNCFSFVIPEELQTEALGQLLFNFTEAMKKHSAVYDVPLNKLGRYVAGVACPELLTSSITRRTKKKKISTWNAFVAIKKAQRTPIGRSEMKTLALEYNEVINVRRAQLEAQAKQLEKEREGPSFAQDAEARLRKWKENISMTITDMYNQAQIHCVVMYASDGALSRTKPATLTNTGNHISAELSFLIFFLVVGEEFENNFEEILQEHGCTLQVQLVRSRKRYHEDRYRRSRRRK